MSLVEPTRLIKQRLRYGRETQAITTCVVFDVSALPHAKLWDTPMHINRNKVRPYWYMQTPAIYNLHDFASPGLRLTIKML